MKIVEFLIGVFFVLSVTACSNGFQTQVQNAVQDNRRATNLTEWERSENNPEKLFQRWRYDFMVNSDERSNIQNNVCDTLLNIDSQELTIFENEINDLNNRAVLSPCKDKLISILDEYYSEQRLSLEFSVDVKSEAPSGNSFRFLPNVQYRDLSRGYVAYSGDVAKKEVILTFDDGPNNIYTESILRTLKEVNAKAIFFHLGKNVRLNPEIVKRAAAEGHAIASHSNSHACLGTSKACHGMLGRNLSFDEAVQEIKKGHQAIYDVLGWVEPFFRFPYAEMSLDLRNFLKQKSTGEFVWNIDSEDWRVQSNENLVRRTMAQVDRLGRGMILFHDIQRRTAESLPQILRELHNRGFSIVLIQAADPNAKYNSKLVERNAP